MILSLLITISTLLLSLGLFYCWNWIFTKKSIDDKTPVIKNIKLRLIVIIFLIASLFYIDFVRAFIFENTTIKMNFQANYEQCLETSGDCGSLVDYSAPSISRFYDNMNSMEIYKWKFYFFFIFGFAYAILSQLITRQAFPNLRTLKIHTLFLLIGYSIILFLFSLFFYPWEIGTKYRWYESSMEISHFFQSSLSCLFLILCFKIYDQIQIEKTN